MNNQIKDEALKRRVVFPFSKTHLNWENSNKIEKIQTSRKVVQVLFWMLSLGVPDLTVWMETLITHKIYSFCTKSAAI